MRKRFLAMLFLPMLAGAAPGMAQAGGSAGNVTGDAQAAKALIAEHCIKCHVAPGFPLGKQQPAAGAPSFAEIAANPARYSDRQIAAFLRQPHYPMQGFVLSRRDIANILAYIHQLREAGGGK